MAARAWLSFGMTLVWILGPGVSRSAWGSTLASKVVLKNQIHHIRAHLPPTQIRFAKARGVYQSQGPEGFIKELSSFARLDEFDRKAMLGAFKGLPRIPEMILGGERSFALIDRHAGYKIEVEIADFDAQVLRINGELFTYRDRESLESAATRVQAILKSSRRVSWHQSVWNQLIPSAHANILIPLLGGAAVALIARMFFGLGKSDTAKNVNKDRAEFAPEVAPSAQPLLAPVGGLPGSHGTPLTFTPEPTKVVATGGQPLVDASLSSEADQAQLILQKENNELRSKLAAQETESLIAAHNKEAEAVQLLLCGFLNARQSGRDRAELIDLSSDTFGRLLTMKWTSTTLPAGWPNKQEKAEFTVVAGEVPAALPVTHLQDFIVRYDSKGEKGKQYTLHRKTRGDATVAPAQVTCPAPRVATPVQPVAANLST